MLKCPKKFQMFEKYWGCLDKMSKVNFSPAETLYGDGATAYSLIQQTGGARG